MEPAVPSPNVFDQSRARNWGPSVRAALTGLFLIQAFLVGAHVWPRIFGGENDGASMLWLVVLAAVASGAAFSLDLPLQTILLAGACIVAVTAGIQVLGMSDVLSSEKPRASGPLLEDPSRAFSIIRLWVWLLVSLNARALARLMLWPFRKRPNIGLWVVGLATGWVMVDLELWVRRLGLPSPLNWSLGFPWNFLAELLVALLIQVAVTPMLIRKRPGESGPAFYTLFVWMGLTLVAVWQ